MTWIADGTRFAGYAVHGLFINAEVLCRCWFEVRFGTRNGERRAYLTADYRHENPGTLVDLAVVNGVLVAARSVIGPPGSYTISGIVTAATADGMRPLEGVRVAREYLTGWHGTISGAGGFYEIPGVYEGIHQVSAWTDGYRTETRSLSINGDVRIDFQLVPR